MRWTYGDDGLRVDFASGEGVVRVETWKPGWRTATGFGVGSAGEGLLGAYGARLKMSFVTFRPGLVADAYGFDVEDGSGLSFRLRADRIEEVRLDGGCAVHRADDLPANT